MKNKACEITISGRVQGVGFRPFIYNLAKNYDIKGFVTNNANGVYINAVAEETVLDAFYEQILLQKPKSSEITSYHKKEIPVTEIFYYFYIKPTAPNLFIDIPLTPDFAICENCSAEMLDTENPRYYYPFTTCTACGPRYTVTKKFPFERMPDIYLYTVSIDNMDPMVTELSPKVQASLAVVKDKVLHLIEELNIKNTILIEK